MSLSRRRTVPQELNDSEDVCVNSESFEGDGDDDEEQQQQQQQKPRMTVLQNIHSWPKEMRNLVAGGIAGATAKSVVAPLDRIKILYQVSSMPFSFRELPNVMRKIIQTEGLDALWKGNTATMVRVFPYSGIQFMTYDRIKTIFLKRHEHGLYYTIADTRTLNKTGLTPIESLLAGMTAGTISVICTYPLDLTRAQLAVLKKHNASTDPIPTKSFSRVLHENYQQRGFPGLFRGITPTLLGILPYSGIAFTLNEQGKREVRKLYFHV